MAQNSLNIYTDITQETKDQLKDVLNGVIENIQVSAVSEAIKNKNGSGTPEGGSVSYKRFANAQLQAYGTARAAGKGNPLQSTPVVINIGDDKEIVEEFEGKDLKLYGIAGLAAKRANNHAKRIAAYLDRKFFSTAVTAGTAYSGSSTDIKDIVDEMIVTAKETSSDFIDGIDAEDLAIVLNGTARKAMKNELDQLPNGTAPSNGKIGMYDSIEVFESNRMPTGTSVLVMLKGSVAEPWYVSEYDVEKINLADAVALENFVYSGAGALNPEAIYYYQETASV